MFVRGVAHLNLDYPKCTQLNGLNGRCSSITLTVKFKKLVAPMGNMHNSVNLPIVKYLFYWSNV